MRSIYPLQRPQASWLWTGFIALLCCPITLLLSAEYEADVLPENGGGTLEKPAWHLDAPKMSVETYEIVKDLLRVDATSIGEGEIGPFWSVGVGWGSRLGHPWNAWNADPSIGSTIDISLRVEQEITRQHRGDRFRGGCGLSLGDGTYILGIFFGVSGITISGENVVKVEDCDNREIKTYRIAMKGGLASVYIDDRDEPIAADVPMLLTEAGQVNRICFGTISKFVTGLYEIAHIKWSNSEAILSRPERLP